MPRFAANLSFLFNEVPFLDRFAEAAQAGFRAVEFAFGYDYQASEIAARAQAAGVEVILINAPPGEFAAGDRGLASLPGREHEFQASVATALRYAKAMRCPKVHVMAGALPEQADEAEIARRWRLFKRHLEFACTEAAKQGITVMIEPINRRDFPHYLMTTQAQAHAIREELARPNLLVKVDFYHAQVVEGDLATKSAGGRSTSVTCRSPTCRDGASPTRGRSTTIVSSACSTSCATTAGSAASTSRPRAPRRGSTGCIG